MGIGERRRHEKSMFVESTGRDGVSCGFIGTRLPCTALPSGHASGACRSTRDWITYRPETVCKQRDL